MLRKAGYSYLIWIYFFCIIFSVFNTFAENDYDKDIELVKYIAEIDRLTICKITWWSLNTTGPYTVQEIINLSDPLLGPYPYLLSHKRARMRRRCNEDGDKPLHLAIRANVSIEVIKVLLDMGADIAQINNVGITPIEYLEPSERMRIHALSKQFRMKAREEIRTERARKEESTKCSINQVLITNLYLGSFCQDIW